MYSASANPKNASNLEAPSVRCFVITTSSHYLRIFSPVGKNIGPEITEPGGQYPTTQSIGLTSDDTSLGDLHNSDELNADKKQENQFPLLEEEGDSRISVAQLTPKPQRIPKGKSKVLGNWGFYPQSEQAPRRTVSHGKNPATGEFKSRQGRTQEDPYSPTERKRKGVLPWNFPSSSNTTLPNKPLGTI